MTVENNDRLDARQRLISTWSTLIHADVRPIVPIQYRDLTYYHPDRIVQVANRETNTLGSNISVVLYHLLLHQDQTVIPWELVVVRGLASTASDARIAKVSIFRLRRHLSDLREPHKYIQTVQGKGYMAP